MAVGDNLFYSKVLTLAKGRVLLVPADDSVRLGNVEDAEDTKDATNLGQVKKLISLIPGSTPYTGEDGITIDPDTHLITVDLQYIQDNLTFPAGIPFSDLTPLIKNETDNSKLLKFSAASIGTGVTRTLTAQNANYVMAGTNIAQSFTQDQTFSGIIITPTGTITTPGSLLQIGFGGAGTGGASGTFVISTTSLSNSIFPGKTGVTVPIGATGDRQSAIGTIRYNTSINKFEFYENGVWANLGGSGNFMHLDGNVDETADGNKTFTGFTTIGYLIGDRHYSTSSVSPNINFVNDITNGKAMFAMTGNSGSADVNYFNVASVAGGNNPVFSAIGISTNIGINLTPKGAGTVSITNLTGSVTDMLTITASGVIGRQAIPSGGGGGVTSVAFGTTPNTNGGDISGVTLNLQPADGTHPGGISLFAQTMGAGIKTFSDDIIIPVGKTLKTPTGSSFLTLDFGTGNGQLKTTTGGLFLNSINQSLVLGNGSISANGGTINFVGSDTINFLGTTINKAIVFQKNTGGNGQVHFFDPVVFKNPNGSILVNATNSQLGSSVLNFESNLYTGSTGVLKYFTIAAIASITVNSLTNLITKYDGTTISTITQGGSHFIKGGFATNARTVTITSDAFTLDDSTIYYNNTSNCAVTLTTTLFNVGQEFWVKKIGNNAATITFTPSSGLIDGAASFTIPTYLMAFTIRFDGTNFWIW